MEMDFRVSWYLVSKWIFGFMDNLIHREMSIFKYSWVSLTRPRGYNTMADGGQIMRFKLDCNEILLFN